MTVFVKFGVEYRPYYKEYVLYISMVLACPNFCEFGSYGHGLPKGLNLSYLILSDRIQNPTTRAKKLRAFETFLKLLTNVVCTLLTFAAQCDRGLMDTSYISANI
jgi:hypothetical protein